MDKRERDAVFNIIAFMVTSARGLEDEPKKYGPLRLVEAVARLCTLLDDSGYSNKTINLLKEKINERKFLVMTDEDSFNNMLDELIDIITNFLIDED